ncbi:MAG: protein translocase subunit SecF [Clostridia bacterium]|nr:protein translocase subunit SecF [Clostridia bacterium]
MDFLKHRYIFLIISFLIIVGGLTYGILHGFRFDIDFKGGTNIQVDLNKEFKNEDIEKIIYDKTGVKPLIQKLTGGVSSVSITTDTLPNEKIDEVVAALKEVYPDMKEPSTRNVQPSFGKELVNSAIKAIVVSIIILLIYIAIRFRTLGFTAAITAIIAQIHDALFIVAIYAFTGLPINATFIAVILTIVGYSINDTIIVYDRIRENKRKITKAADLKDTINTSLNQTMRRTIYTSFTTVMAISVVYVFALLNNQKVLEEFSLPLILGVLAGAYSSIFIASSLWYIFESKMGKKAKASK